MFFIILIRRPYRSFPCHLYYTGSCVLDDLLTYSGVSILEMFKNNVPQRKIGRDLDISPSTVHNIIKRFKESGGISVRKGQGRKPKLNNRDLRSLRRHCNQESSFIYKRYHHMGSGLLWQTFVKYHNT